MYGGGHSVQCHFMKSFVIVFFTNKLFSPLLLLRVEEIPVCPVFSVWPRCRYCSFKDHEDEGASLCYF